MNLLSDYWLLRESGRSRGYVALANRLASYEEQLETARKFRDYEDGSEGDYRGYLESLSALYDSLPTVRLDAVPEPPSSYVRIRLSPDYFGPKRRTGEKRCMVCRKTGHNRLTCSRR